MPYISDFDVLEPRASGRSGKRKNGPDEIQLVKETIKSTLPGLTGAMNATHTELNSFKGVQQAVIGVLNLGEDAGGDDDYVLTIAGVSSYYEGLRAFFKAATALAAGATLNINSIGAVAIVDMFGDDVTRPAGAPIDVVYVNSKWQLMSV